jgi:hypothetical protein
MNSSILDKVSKILLLVNSFISILGYVAFLQTEHQLVSPLIPSSMILEISKHSIIASFPSSVLLVISLFFYLIDKKIFSLVISSLALISYIILSNYIFL